MKKRMDNTRIMLPKYKIILPCFLLRALNTYIISPPGDTFFALTIIDPITIPTTPPTRQEIYPMITQIAILFPGGERYIF